MVMYIRLTQHFTRKPRAPSLECGPVVPDTLPSDELPQSKEDFPSKSTASEKDPGLKNETMKSMLADVSTPKSSIFFSKRDICTKIRIDP